MHNKDKVIFDKKLPYEYNICLYILEELCDKGVIDVFEMTEALIPRRVFANNKNLTSPLLMANASQILFCRILLFKIFVVNNIAILSVKMRFKTA